MSFWSILAGALVQPVSRLIGRALDRVLPPKHPDIAYDREAGTRRWLAELEGCRAVGDTRRAAAAEVIKMVAARKRRRERA